MKIKGIVDEDFVNYKKPCMFIITSYCNWKCCIEAGIPITVCQNEPLAQQPIKTISDSYIVDAYINNNITQSIVFGGLEPMEQFDEVFELIKKFREKTDDDIVIYTGFYESEIENKINLLSTFKNIIIKYGRYIPGHKAHFDEVLGINLASDNQYAVKIS